MHCSPEIEQLFRRQYENLCLYSYGYVADLAIAEDIVQDIFVSLLRKESKDVLNLEAYITRSVRNASLNALRRSRNLTPLNEQTLFVATDEDLDLDFENNELQERMKIALERLPKKCKKVFELCALEGKKYDVAAESLDISVNTVKSHMKKAYKTLRLELRNTYILIIALAIFLLK